MRTAGVVLLWLSVLATLLAAIMAATGGFAFEFGSVRVSMHAVLRPVLAAMAFGIGAVILLRRDGMLHALDPLESRLSSIGPPVAAAFAVAIAVATYAGGAQVAGGTDSSGYISEANLWREAGLFDLRGLQRDTPLARDLTLANRQYPFTPAGYQPAGPGVIVPGYPPGLPLHFAFAAMLGGEQLRSAVVPLCAAGVVIVAFLIGRRLGGAGAALIAAAAAGGSPILVYQAAQPMSDAVAAFWSSLAVLLLLIRPTTAVSTLGGVAFSIACLVRPNLFAMAPILVLLAWWWRGLGWRSMLPLAAACIPVALAAAWFAYFQRTLYGDPSTTGYGEVSTLFALHNVMPNLVRYPRWAVFAQSALLVASAGAPLAIRFGWVQPEIDRVQAERFAWSGLVFFACLQGFYLLYLVFDDWVYFRFLLPALPWLLTLQSVTLLAAARRLVPRPFTGVAIILIAILVGSWGVGRARGLGAFRLRDSEQRYAEVARFARGLPPNAVFVTLQHSGSLWHYNGANVLRWDWLEAGEVERALAAFVSAGRPVFLVLENWEEPRFRERFAGTPLASRMSNPLFEAGVPTEIIVRVYAVGTGIGAPVVTSGAPREIIARAYAIRGAPIAAGAAPVSSPPPPAPRSPRTPATPGP